MSTSTNSFGITFRLKKNQPKATKGIIYMRVTVNGKRAELSTKRTIEEVSWNNVKGMAKGNKQEIVQLNNYLEKLRAQLVECYQELTLRKKLVTAELVKNNYLKGDEKEFTLCSLIAYHEEDAKTTLAPGTMKNYCTTEKYLKMALKKIYRTDDIYLSELTYAFIIDFEKFLRNYQPLDHQKRLHTNGIKKHIERFRKMINLAITMEWLDKDPFLKYKKKSDKVQREFLTKNELQRIENKIFKIERLEQVKDLFLFSCYTGLAYIDALNLRPDQVFLGDDDHYWLNTTRQKTTSLVSIPLLPLPLRIMDKYKDNPKMVAKNRLLPMLSNQKLNAYLKEIADTCNIHKPLTFHIARHTFATTVTLTNGVPIESVSKMLGHTSLRTTQIYAKVVESKLSEDMSKLRNKMILLDGVV